MLLTLVQLWILELVWIHLIIITEMRNTDAWNTNAKKCTEKEERRIWNKSKGNQSWVFIGRTDVEAETPILWPPDLKSWFIWKDWCWDRLRTGGDGGDRGWDGWMALPTQWTWVWVNSGVGDAQGGLVCWGSWGHKESDMTERPNWLNWC